MFRILIRTYLCIFPTLLFVVLFTCWMCVVSLHHYRWKLVRWNLVIRSSRRATTQSWIALVRLLNFVAAAAVATVRRFWFKEILSVHALTHRTVSKRRFLVNFTIDNNIVKLRSFLARSFNNSYLPRIIYDDANKSRFEQIRKKFFVFSSYYRCKKKSAFRSGSIRKARCSKEMLIVDGFVRSRTPRTTFAIKRRRKSMLFLPARTLHASKISLLSFGHCPILSVWPPTKQNDKD